MGFFRHGVLTLPLTFMLFFGLLGFRPGQLFNKIIALILNTMFLFNYVLIVTIGIGYFMQSNYEDIFGKFYVGFSIVAMMKFTALLHVYYKKYNLMSLLEDITDARKYNLSGMEISFVVFTFLSVIVCTIFCITDVSKIVFSGFHFAFKTSGPILPKLM